MSPVPLSEVIPEIISGVMGADIESGLWDAPPMLFFICAPKPESPEQYRLTIIESIDPLWGILGDPVRVVQFLSVLITEAPPETDMPFGVDADEQVLAVVLRNEGYGLDSKDTSMTAEEIKAYTQGGGRIADHPDGKECKIYTAVSEDSQLSFTHYRGTDGIVGHEHLEGGTMEGRVPDVLNGLLLAARLRWPG